MKHAFKTISILPAPSNVFPEDDNNDVVGVKMPNATFVVLNDGRHERRRNGRVYIRGTVGNGGNN